MANRRSGAVLAGGRLARRVCSLAGDKCDWQLQNPELIAQVLDDPDLLSLPLLLCGIAAEQRAQELEMNFPHLRGRVGGWL